MTVEYECTQCGEKFHPPFGLVDNIIQHIVEEHLDGEAMFEKVMQWILVRAHGPVEEE